MIRYMDRIKWIYLGAKIENSGLSWQKSKLSSAHDECYPDEIPPPQLPRPFKPWRILCVVLALLWGVPLASATCSNAMLYDGTQSVAFEPMDWPNAPVTSQNWGSFGNGIEFPYLLISGQKSSADSWQSAWPLALGTDLTDRSIALSVRTTVAHNWAFRLQDRSGNFSGYLSQDIPAYTSSRIHLPARNFSGGLDLTNIRAVYMELLDVPAWTWMDVEMDSVALECTGAATAIPSVGESKITLQSAKVKTESNYVQYVVTVRNDGNGMATRPSVSYFAKLDSVLNAAVDYSNPAGVTVNGVHSQKGFTRVSFQLPGDLGAGQQAVFHVRLYKSDWTVRDFSNDWSNQRTSNVEEPNPLWTVRNASDSLLYGTDPLTIERQSDVVVWFGNNGPQAIQPYVAGDPSVLTAVRFWLLAKDPLTTKEVASLAGLGLRRLEGQVYQGYSQYLMFQNTGSVTRAALNKVVSGFYNAWPVDTAGNIFERAQIPAGDTSAAYHVQATCWPDVSTATCRSQVVSCNANNVEADYSLVLADIPKSAVSCLLAKNGIRNLSEQATYGVTNNTARVASHIDSVQSSTAWTSALATSPPTVDWLKGVPYTGDGIVVGVYDTGLDTNHLDFKEVSATGDTVARVVRLSEIHAVNPSLVLSWMKGRDLITNDAAGHGTHVAGIIGGNGWLSKYEYRGVAPKVHFFQFGFGYIRQIGHVANHSHTLDGNPGYYLGASADLDAHIFLNIWPSGDSLVKTQVWAAGNQGMPGLTEYGAQAGYHSLGIQAKNPITVGMYESYTGKRATGSSMGPTWDGRIKPDVMAPGGRNQIGVSVAHPLVIYVDYVKLYHAGSTTPYWTDNFTTLSGWDTSSTGPSEFGHFNLVMDSVAQSNALRWVDSMSRGNGTCIISKLIRPSLAMSVGDEIEVRMRVSNSGSPYASLNGKVGVGYDSTGFYANTNYTMYGSPWSLHTDGSYQTTRSKIGKDAAAYYLRLDVTHGEGVWSTFPTWSSSPYREWSGTSMAAPHVTGIVALLLQKYRELTGKSFLEKPLRNSTTKAILIHTATDMVDTAGDSIQGNPDITATMADGKTYYTRIFPGPDFATGWGKVNGKAALEKVDTTLFQETPVGYSEELRWSLQVSAGQAHLRTTLVWDDPPKILPTGIAYENAYLDPALVNDLDMALISPSGMVHYPWRLDPMPTGVAVYDTGNIWRGSGLEPIRDNDVKPAYKKCSSDSLSMSCFDHRNNVEVVDVDAPEVGTWTLWVRGTRVVQGNSTDSASQWASIVADNALVGPVRSNSHPYAANQDSKYTYALGNNLFTEVSFSDSTCLGTGDTIKIFNGYGRLVGAYTGCDLQGQTVEVSGSTFTVELISNNDGVQGYGFAIAKIAGLTYPLLPLLWEATKKIK